MSTTAARAGIRVIFSMLSPDRGFVDSDNRRSGVFAIRKRSEGTPRSSMQSVFPGQFFLHASAARKWGPALSAFGKSAAMQRKAGTPKRVGPVEERGQAFVKKSQDCTQTS